MPVREALHRLVAKGALEFLPNRTASVPMLTLAEFDQLCDVRIHLECYATEIAAKQISTEEIQALERTHREIISISKSMRRRSNPEPLLLANARFHFGVYHAARSRHLVPLIESLWLLMGPLRLGPFLHTEELRTEIDESHIQHKQLVAALERGDSAQARKLMKGLLERATGWYRDFNEFAEDDGTAHAAPISDLIL